MSEKLWVLGTLVIYKIALISIGLASRKRVRDEEDYFLGGRGLGPWVAAISASASSSSAWTLLGVSGAAYRFGLAALWFLPACVGGFALNWYVLAPRLRRLSRAHGTITVTQILAGNPGERGHLAVRIVASAIVVFSLGAYVASQFAGSGTTFQSAFGLDRESSILIGSGVVIFYTLIGGFWAVSLTDTLQGLMMAFTAVLLPLGAVIAAGGPGEILDGLAERPELLSMTRQLTPVAAFGFVAGVLGIGLGYPGQPHVVNRFMAMRDDEAALRLSRRIAMTWALIVYSGMIVVGLAGRTLLGDGLLAAGDRSETVFIESASQTFHPVLAAVMIAAVLSAIMSTADSQLLVAASSLSHDRGLGGRDPRRLVRRSRLIVIAVSAVALALALAFEERIYDRVLFAWSAMGAAFGPLLLVTVWRGPVPPRRALASMLVGFSLAVAASFIREGDPPPLVELKGVFERVLPFAAAGLIAWRR